MSVLAVTGLTREARIAADSAVTAVSGGGDAAALAAKIGSATWPSTTGLISFGIAGALDPELPVGAVLVATEIAAEQGCYATDIRWREAILLRLAGARSGTLWGSDVIVAARAQKQALHARSKALAVDMESHVVARVARARGLAFAALRVVSDCADDSLPPAATVAMTPDGGLAIGKVLRSIAAQPSQIPGLLRTARDSEMAFAALLRCRNLLGLGLACPYLG